MDISDFLKLGFNKNEAIVYLALIKVGKSDAHQLIAKTKFHKNIVYDNLNKLIDRGLVTYVEEGGKRIFHTAQGYPLIEMFNEEARKVEEKKKEAEKLSEEIEKLNKELPQRQEATIYRGIKGIKAFYQETLKRDPYVVFGAPKESIEIMGLHFWMNYNQKRAEQKLATRLLFNPSLHTYGETIKNDYTKVRYFERDFEPLTETHIQNDRVAIMVWSEEPILILIQDHNVAKAYKAFFEKMWEQGSE